MDIYYVDGKFVPADEAFIPVNDMAVLRGYGVFDLLRTYGGKPFFLEAHIKRLYHSAQKIGLPIPWSEAQITNIIMETLGKNSHPESNVRIVVTGGSSPDFSTPKGQPRLLVLVSAVPQLPDPWYTDGVKIITVTVDRPLAGTKSIDYIPATMAMKQAREQGAIEAIYMDRDGFVQEGTTSNLFAFFGNRLTTPGRGILAGITRQVTLDLAKGLFDIAIRDIARSELLTADEIFITGTNKGMVPVVQVDTTVIGNGCPGPRTRQMIQELADQTARFATQR
jgi:branched-chain amino acid aminotransferase